MNARLNDPAALPLERQPLITKLITGRVDPSAVQIKTSCSCRESNHYTTYATPVPVEVPEEEKPLAPTGMRTPIIQPAASRCTDYATPGPEALIIKVTLI
jgi:hypothetical protein